MNKIRATSDLYGKFQFRHSVDSLRLPEGFIKYHKANFSKYFNISEDGFSGLRVLDTGCGPGKHAVVLSLMGADVTAMDLSYDNIKRGNKIKNFYKLDNLKFTRYDLMKPIKDEAGFDLISAHNWMQHAENPSIVFKNLVQVLKKRGRIYLSLYLAGTFRFFTVQIARSVLKPDHFNLMRDLVKYHFPSGFKEFGNPDDIYMENIFDDYFVPYCNTATFDIVMEDAERLGCTPITPKPDLNETRGLDNIPLRMGFERRKEVSFSGKMAFTGPVDEFKEPMPPYARKSAGLAVKIINRLKKLGDPFIICSFCLGLYRLRSATSRMTDGTEKYKILETYLEMCLSNSIKPIAAFYDTQKLLEG